MNFKLDYLIDLLGDYDAIHDMMKLFIHQVPEDMKLLEESIEKNEIEAIRIYSHKIKSSMAMFQAEPIRQMMEKIEHMSRNHGSVEEIAALYSETRPSIDCIRQEMEEYLSAHI